MRKHFYQLSRWTLLGAIVVLPLLLSAQETSIQGMVSCAAAGKPLSGVRVQEKGRSNHVVTGADGRYEIKVRQNFFTDLSAPILEFSCAGYQAMEFGVMGRAALDVKLWPEEAGLAGQFQTGTGAGRPLADLPYAVSQVDEAFFQRVPAPNLAGGLQGKVAGLRANSGGQPGSPIALQLRAANSIANGQAPLILLDGIYLGPTSLADINPEDIEKIEVLKGAAAAAFYGSQAANGVIQIFTKTGKSLEPGATRITYRNELGISRQPQSLPINEFTNREIVSVQGLQPLLGNPTADAVHRTPLPRRQDYQSDLLFRDGAFRSHYLAVQSRSSATHFLASGQHFREEGLLKRLEGYERTALRVNLGHQASTRLRFHFNAMYSSAQQGLDEPHANGTGSLLANTLLLTPMFGLDAVNEEDDSPYDWDIDNTGFGVTNPLYLRHNSRQTATRSRLLGRLGADFQATSWLAFAYNATLDRATSNYEHYLEKGFLSTDPPGMFGALASAGVDGSNGGGIQRTSQSGSYLTSSLDAVAQRRFLGFTAAARAGMLYEQFSREFDATQGEDLAVADIRSLDNAQRGLAISSEQQEMLAYSFYLAGDADYRQKYFFSGALRQEQSSLFGQEENWDTYYRLAGAYRLTKDIRLKPFQDLKLRAAVGTAGIRPFYDQRFETFDLIGGLTNKRTLGNENLLPAKTRELEIGADATFLRAFRLDFSYVQATTTGQILLAPLSGAAGFSGQWRNAGTVEAQMYEAGLDLDLAKLFRVRSSGFRWNVFTTFSRMSQTVAQLDVPAYVTGPGLLHTNLFLIEAGAPLGAMVGEAFATRPEELPADLRPQDFTLNSQGYLVPRDVLGTPEERPVKLRDENGNPLIQQIGDINPDFRMGFAHFLSFKGLDIYALFDWKKGGDVYNLTRQWMYAYERHADLSADPSIAGGFYGPTGLANEMTPNRHFVEDGSFFMLREASISYTLQNQLFNGLIESARFSLIGRNLFTTTPYSGFHPDVSIAGRDEYRLSHRLAGGRGSEARTPFGDPSLFLVDAFNLPLPRTFTFSLQLTF
jgi:TonB-linked SusC/RagA family outer membrane protein